MKLICVAGGSYKSFYLNYFLHTLSCDLLIFNFDIIYDYDEQEEKEVFPLVSTEIEAISKSLKTKVVAGVKLKKTGQKALLIYDGGKFEIKDLKFGAKVTIKNKIFVVGNEYTNYGNHHKIVLTQKRIFPNLNHCVRKKIYVFVDKFGVGVVKNKKISRKFCKYSKIILN